MNLIETYNGSGFYAQYATSAEKDNKGNPLSSYMVESKFGFNNNLITGYNGSGFAGEGGGTGGDYVPLTATDCEIGENTSAVNVALAQGQNCYADKYALAQGYYSSAYGNSLSVGYCNNVGDMQYWPESIVEGDVIPAHTDYYGNSLAVGESNSARVESLSVGKSNLAGTQSLALGINNYAADKSITIGTNNKATYKAVCFGSFNSANFESIACGYYNYAAEDSQAFGTNLKAYIYSNAGNVRHGTFAIGSYNKTSATPFVIGDGTGDSERSDLFVIDANGNVSSTKGFFYDKDGRVGNYHSASARVTNTGTNFTITLTSNNSYVALDSSSVSGTQSLNFTIVPPHLEQDELLDCMVQFSPVGGTSTNGHTVSANGLIQVGVRKSTIGGLNLNYIQNGETAQIRLLGNTYCLM